MQHLKSFLILLLLIGYATMAQAGLDHADIYCENSKSQIIVVINKTAGSFKGDIFIGGAQGEHIQTDFVMPMVTNSMQLFRDHRGNIIINTHLERPYGNITIKTDFGQVLLNQVELQCEKNVPLESL